LFVIFNKKKKKKTRSLILILIENNNINEHNSIVMSDVRCTKFLFLSLCLVLRFLDRFCRLYPLFLFFLSNIG
jgi:hypothetical protein